MNRPDCGMPSGYSSETMEERIARMLGVYAARACAPLRPEEARAGAKAMAEGLSARGIVADELYDLFEIAVIYKAVPDYRSCIRAINSADWETACNRRRAARRAREASDSQDAQIRAESSIAGDPIDARMLARMRGQSSLEAFGREEVWRWWQTLESCPPSIRMGYYEGEICPYGKMREVFLRLESYGYKPKWETWTRSHDGKIFCDGIECDFSIG